MKQHVTLCVQQQDMHACILSQKKLSSCKVRSFCKAVERCVGWILFKMSPGFMWGFGRVNRVWTLLGALWFKEHCNLSTIPSHNFSDSQVAAGDTNCSPSPSTTPVQLCTTVGTYYINVDFLWSSPVHNKPQLDSTRDSHPSADVPTQKPLNLLPV